MEKEASLTPPYAVWAGALSWGHGPTSPRFACRAWFRACQPHCQGFREVWEGSASYNMEKYTECKTHKIGFEILRFSFLVLCAGLPLWIFWVFVLCSHTKDVFTLYSSTDFRVWLLPFFTFFSLLSQFQVWIFWGRFEVCSASLSKGQCGICIVGGTCHRMWHAASLQAGAMLVLCTPSKGESQRVRGIIHIKQILLFQLCYYFFLLLAACSV